MDCEVCDKIFRKITSIDYLVMDSECKIDYWEYRLNELRFSSVRKEATELIEKHLAQSREIFLQRKEKQIKRHKKLTKHYREVHLNGEI